MAAKKLKEEKKKVKQTKAEKKEIAMQPSTECRDRKCPFHGNLKTRGRKFEGKVVKKTHKTVKVEWPRFKFFPKYERYAKTRSRVQAHLPDCLSGIEVGTQVKISECRPLSKTKHFVVTGILKTAI